jgi:hypothetical protein
MNYKKVFVKLNNYLKEELKFSESEYQQALEVAPGSYGCGHDKGYLEALIDIQILLNDFTESEKD